MTELPAQISQFHGFLRELDDLLKTKEKLEIYLIGGAAITLAYDATNRTADFDLIDPPDAVVRLGGKGSRLAKKYRVYVSPLAAINFSVPEDWRQKCRPLVLSLKHLEILVACVEDIVLGKIARMEPKDLEDILSLKDRGELDAKRLLSRLRENKKELQVPEYRNNSKLLFKEVFDLILLFEKGDVKVR